MCYATSNVTFILLTSSSLNFNIYKSKFLELKFQNDNNVMINTNEIIKWFNICYT